MFSYFVKSPLRSTLLEDNEVFCVVFRYSRTNTCVRCGGLFKFSSNVCLRVP